MKLSYYMRGLGTGIVVTALIMGIAMRNSNPVALTDAEIKAAAEKLGMVESSSLKLSDLPAASGEGNRGEPGGGSSQPGGPEESKGSESGEPGGGSSQPEVPEESKGSESGEPGGGSSQPEGPEESEGSEPGEPGGGSSQPEGPEGGGQTSGAGAAEDAGTSGPGGDSQGIPATGDGADGQTASGQGETVTVTVNRGTGSRAICNRLEELGLIEDARDFDQYLIDNGYSKRISVGTYEIETGADWETIAKIITKSR